ncbi:hypothetical protein H5410_056690, partial [Solanum commersonii]
MVYRYFNAFIVEESFIQAKPYKPTQGVTLKMVGLKETPKENLLFHFLIFNMISLDASSRRCQPQLPKNHLRLCDANTLSRFKASLTKKEEEVILILADFLET